MVNFGAGNQKNVKWKDIKAYILKAAADELQWCNYKKVIWKWFLAKAETTLQIISNSNWKIKRV